jgi:threonine/homoserine/homoserine lactone efflux protein
MPEWFYEFLTLAGVHFLALLSPGPDFFLLVGSTAKNGRKNGAGVAVGIAFANAGYIVCALAGFNLLARHRCMHQTLQWLGAGYLGWLGWIFLRSARAAPHRAGLSRASDREHGFLSGVLAGFLSGALNPKNGLFYLGLFSTAVGAGTPAGVRAFFGVWMFAVVLVWDLLLAFMLDTERAMGRLGRFLPKVEGFAGVCLICLAVIVIAGLV